MNLSYTEEQLLLRDSVQKFISDKYDISERNKITATDEGFSRENWQLFAELGWLALPFDEEDGGIKAVAGITRSSVRGTRLNSPCVTV